MPSKKQPEALQFKSPENDVLRQNLDKCKNVWHPKANFDDFWGRVFIEEVAFIRINTVDLPILRYSMQMS